MRDRIRVEVEHPTPTQSQPFRFHAMPLFWQRGLAWSLELLLISILFLRLFLILFVSNTNKNMEYISFMIWIYARKWIPQKIQTKSKCKDNRKLSNAPKSLPQYSVWERKRPHILFFTHYLACTQHIKLFFCLYQTHVLTAGCKKPFWHKKKSVAHESS